jgi:hypothetical protein
MTVTDSSDRARSDGAGPPTTPKRRFTRTQVTARRTRPDAADARMKALVARTAEMLAALRTGRS